jgi:hypothetical protein
VVSIFTARLLMFSNCVVFLYGVSTSWIKVFIFVSSLAASCFISQLFNGMWRNLTLKHYVTSFNANLIFIRMGAANIYFGWNKCKFHHLQINGIISGLSSIAADRTPALSHKKPASPRDLCWQKKCSGIQNTHRTQYKANFTGSYVIFRTSRQMT